MQDCTARRESAVTSFTATRTGFTAQADLEAENLVLFSVPYDDGFTATVNGVPAEVEKVDNGLMAVAAPAGHSEIVFTYHTAGLRQSVAVSAGAIVVYAVWVAVLHRKKRRAAAETAVKNAIADSTFHHNGFFLRKQPKRRNWNGKIRIDGDF